MIFNILFAIEIPLLFYMLYVCVRYNYMSVKVVAIRLRFVLGFIVLNTLINIGRFIWGLL